MRSTFTSEIPQWISLQPNIRGDWSQCLQTLEGHKDGIRSVSFSHDSALVASGSEDTTIRIWCTATGECVKALVSHDGRVESVTFSHDSALMASGSLDETVRI